MVKDTGLRHLQAMPLDALAVFKADLFPVTAASNEQYPPTPIS